MRALVKFAIALSGGVLVACDSDDGPAAGSAGAGGSAAGRAGASSGGSGASSSGGSSGGGANGTGGSSGSSGGMGTSGTSGASGTSGGRSGTSGTGGSSGGAQPGWPDASNTGIPDGACPGGLKGATIAETEPKSNATIQCVLFTGAMPYLRQGVSNVSYRYCRFETTRDVFLNLQGGPVTIEDSEFSGPAGTWIRAVYEANGLVVRRCDFSGMANAIEFGTNNVVIEDNYVHDFGNVSQDQHADGFQTEGADAFSIVHNSVLFNDVQGSTSCLLVSGTNSMVKNNLVAGGGYTIHVAGDIEVTGNHVSTMFHPKSGIYGPVYPESLAASGVWQDNVWHDGPDAGKALPAP